MIKLLLFVAVPIVATGLVALGTAGVIMLNRMRRRLRADARRDAAKVMAWRDASWRVPPAGKRGA